MNTNSKCPHFPHGETEAQVYPAAPEPHYGKRSWPSALMGQSGQYLWPKEERWQRLEQARLRLVRLRGTVLGFLGLEWQATELRSGEMSYWLALLLHSFFLQLLHQHVPWILAIALLFHLHALLSLFGKLLFILQNPGSNAPSSGSHFWSSKKSLHFPLGFCCPRSLSFCSGSDHLGPSVTVHCNSIPALACLLHTSRSLHMLFISNALSSLFHLAHP